MTEAHMRLRRVRLKGGPDIHVLHNRPAPDGGTDWRGHNCGVRIDHDTNLIPMTLLPAYIEEIVRRYTVTNAEAETKFHEIFEWRDGA